MKILFFLDKFGPGGKERRVVELLKGLSKDPEIKMELVVMDTEIHFKAVFDLKIPVHYLIRKSKKDFGVFHKLYKICKKFRPDFMHTWDSMTSVYSAPICLLLRIKLINSMITNTLIKGDYLNKYWLRARLTFPFSTLIVANSKAGLSSYHAPERKSIFIYNGFDSKRLNNLQEKKEIISKYNIETRYSVIMVAMFKDTKDYHTYFACAENTLKKRNDITFIAIGDGVNLEKYKNLVQKNNISNVKILGRQSNVESIINVCDIGIMCTNSLLQGEGISNSIMEYMALGKPVIATEGGGTSEIVDHNVTGYVIPPQNPELLSNYICGLLDNLEIRERMGVLGKNRIEERFSIELMLEKYLRIYSDLLKK
jgi:glycosyltransferase involved in cell wall biosynthesis